MASEVDIANLALGHLGDAATVSSIDPPEGSPQAEHCQRFYPIARDSLLEMHLWNFAMKRQALPLLTNDWPEWLYCYGLPSDALNPITVLPSDALDDYSLGVMPGNDDFTTWPGYIGVGAVVGVPTTYEPQPFTIETLASGDQVLYTNVANAVLRYSAYVTDTTQFSPLFVTTLSWQLASFLAGPLIKGDAGAEEAKRCQVMMQRYMDMAVSSDSNQRKVNVRQSVSWMNGR